MGIIREPDDRDPALLGAPKHGRVIVEIAAHTPLTCSLACSCWYLLTGEQAVICYAHEVEALERLFFEKSTST